MTSGQCGGPPGASHDLPWAPALHRFFPPFPVGSSFFLLLLLHVGRCCQGAAARSWGSPRAALQSVACLSPSLLLLLGPLNSSGLSRPFGFSVCAIMQRACQLSSLRVMLLGSVHRALSRFVRAARTCLAGAPCFGAARPLGVFAACVAIGIALLAPAACLLPAAAPFSLPPGPSAA